MFPVSSLHTPSCDSSRETVQSWTWGVWDVSLKLLVLKVRRGLSWLAELRPWGAHCANTVWVRLYLLSIVQSDGSFRRVWNLSINHSIGMRESFNCSLVFYQQAQLHWRAQSCACPLWAFSFLSLFSMFLFKGKWEKKKTLKWCLKKVGN